MKKLIVVSLVALAACAGCNTTRIGADPVALGTETTTVYVGGDTNRVASVTTRPVYAFGWWANSYRNLVDTQIADMAFQYGEASASVKGYGNTVSVEAVKVLSDAATTIAAKVCAAIVTCGGSVAGEAAVGSIRDCIARFVSKGGDASAAKVECASGTCVITDGKVTESCANCYECGE